MPELYETKVLQNEQEFARWIEILRREKVTSYLEIGSNTGGSLWRIANALPFNSRLVAVDMPSSEKNRNSLLAAVNAIRKRSNVDVFIGNSMSTTIIERVQARGPFDAVFIDGEHTLEVIQSDWKHYGCLGRIVAFHDISWRRDRVRQPGHFWIEVPEFWTSIKDRYPHEEIKLEHKNNGIGVLWRTTGHAATFRPPGSSA